MNGKCYFKQSFSLKYTPSNLLQEHICRFCKHLIFFPDKIKPGFYLWLQGCQDWLIGYANPSSLQNMTRIGISSAWPALQPRRFSTPE